MSSLPPLSTIIVRITVGAALFACNSLAGLLIVIVLRNRRLGTFTLVAAMLMADGLYGLAFVLNGLYYLSIETAGTSGLLVTKWFCVLRPRTLVFIVSMPLIALLPFSLSIERLFAVFSPVFYHHHGNKLAYSLIGISLVLLFINLFILVGKSIGNNDLVSIACGQTEIFTEFERKYLSLFRITVTVVAIVAYVPIILRMRKSVDKLTIVNSPQVQVSKRLNRLIALNVLNTLVLFNIPDIAFFIIGTSNDVASTVSSNSSNSSTNSLINGTLLCSRGIVSTAIFVLGNGDLSNALRRWLCFFKATRIVPSSPPKIGPSRSQAEFAHN